MMAKHPSPTVSRDPQTHRYRALVQLEIEEEFFTRAFLRAIEEAGETLNLADPEVVSSLVVQVADVRKWLNHPQVRLTPVIQLPVEVTPVVEGTVGAVRESSSPVTPPRPVVVAKPKPETHWERLEKRLREQVRCVAPHLWEEQCRTPIASKSLPSKDYQDISRLRSDERKVLKKLLEEWKQGTLFLEQEALEEEKRYQNEEEAKLLTTLEAVSGAVNGNRLH